VALISSFLGIKGIKKWKEKTFWIKNNKRVLIKFFRNKKNTDNSEANSWLT
jgi:hypothetical protein